MISFTVPCSFLMPCLATDLLKISTVDAGLVDGGAPAPPRSLKTGPPPLWLMVGGAAL